MRWSLLVLVACGNAAPATDPIAVHVDHRLEASAIVERLAGKQEWHRAQDCAYVRDVDATFAPFATHPAVAKMRDFGFERGPRDALEGHQVPLDDFIKAADTEAFFASHAAYLASVEAAFRAAIPGAKISAFLTREFGTLPAFQVNPSLLQGPENYGLPGRALVGLGEVDAACLPKHVDLDLVVHEMSHGTVNPLIDGAGLDAVAEKLFASARTQMQAQHYTTPRIMLYESVVRAIVVAWIRDSRGDAVAAREISDQQRLGFAWIADLEHVVTPKLDLEKVKAFFTQLTPTFQGPIDAVYASGAFSIVYSPATEAYARSIADTIFHGHASLSPAFTTPQGNLVAYGSPTTNPIVARIAERAGWKLDASGLQLGSKHFTGTIVMIAAWPREDDPAKAVIVYTAASDADVIGLNELRAGPTDYIVAEKTATGYSVLDRGEFSHAPWQLP